MDARSTGFNEAHVEIGTNPSANVGEGVLPDIDVNTYSVKFYYCCRKDGILTLPVDFPNTKPFVLLQRSSAGCQQVKGESTLL